MTWARLFTTCLGVALGLLVALPAAGDGRGGAGGLELTLDDAIELALRNNRSLRRARLGRETDRFALEVAEDRYRPRVIFSASARETNRRPAAGELTVGPSLRVPTGGELVLRWSEALAGGNGEDRSWTLGFSQPILRGFGSGIDTC